MDKHIRNINNIYGYIAEFGYELDDRGYLTHIEGARDIPFDIKRVFYIYKVPSGQTRGGHAHLKCEQVIIVLTGCCDIDVGDKGYTINEPSVGIYVPARTKVTLSNFRPNTVVLVLASEHYEDEDYYVE